MEEEEEDESGLVVKKKGGGGAGNNTHNGAVAIAVCFRYQEKKRELWSLESPGCVTRFKQKSQCVCVLRTTSGGDPGGDGRRLNKQFH